jgi:ubiquinone/menaquinone biosynthesis C-methylase UbiE
MDQPAASPEALRRSLIFIRRINRWLGYARATVWHLERFSRNWKRGESIRIVDFATGAADIPRAILHWSRRRGFDVRIVGLDLHATTLSIAAAAGDRDAALGLVRGDATRAPFADGAFDYALTGMFLHHLSEHHAVAVLREMDRVSRRGIIAADLLRHRRAAAWIRLLTLASDPMVRHDALVSVRQAFSRSEVLDLRREAGVGYAKYYRHFGHRFVLAGERGAASFGA